MRRTATILTGLLIALVLGTTTNTVALATEPTFRVYPSGLAKIMLGDTSDRLVIWSEESDSVHYELSDEQGSVAANGTLSGVRTLEVQTMGGDDRLAIGDEGLSVGLIVYTGQGDDVIELQKFDASRGQQARIYSGSGDDNIVADFAEGTPEHFWVFTDGGDDTLVVRNSSFDVDRLGILHVRAGTGNDTVYTEGNSFGRFRVKTGGGVDNWTSESDTFHGPLRYVSRGGDDTVAVSAANVVAGASVRSGSGADAVEIRSGSFDGAVVFDGGAGTADQLTISPTATFDRPPTLLGFEY